MVPRSLQGRMLLLSGLAMLLALAIAGWTIAGVLERFVTAGLDRRLDSQVSLLAATVDADGRIDRTLLQQRAGALEGGPGWRWCIVAPKVTLGSADFPTLDTPPHPPTPGEPWKHDRRESGPRGPSPLDGAGENGVRVHARQLTITTTGGPVTITAAAPREVVQRPIREALAPLLAALAALAGLLGTATLLQLRLGLKPLRLLRDQVAAIRIGAREQVDEEQPTELRPLAKELNALTRDTASALAAARQSAANLAHALKTPVATLALDLRNEPARAAQVARIDATIHHHLARARTEAVNRRVVTPLAPAVNDLVTAVRGLHAGRDLVIEADVGPDFAVSVDPCDLDELIGNLLDNAARHASSKVSITAARAAEGSRRVLVAIADDGPGIPVAEQARVAQAGTRLDERGDGHGFGLSIVSELVSLYGGAIAMHETIGGGLTVSLELPSAAAPKLLDGRRIVSSRYGAHQR